MTLLLLSGGKPSVLDFLMTDVVILCGGFGKRLQSVSFERPKPMVLIGTKPFLEILVDHIASYGFRRFIFCTYYKTEVIREYFQKKSGLDIVFSEEPQPLGTGGALKFCAHVLQNNVALVFNGDSFCPIDPLAFLKFHEQKCGVASVVVTRHQGRCDGGFINLGTDKRIVSFHEKRDVDQACYINAGIYAFSRNLIFDIPSEHPCSLENEVFPQLIENNIYGYETFESLYDIGTPERLDFFRQSFSQRQSIL